MPSDGKSKVGADLSVRHLGCFLDHLGGWLQAQTEVIELLIFQEPRSFYPTRGSSVGQESVFAGSWLPVSLENDRVVTAPRTVGTGTALPLDRPHRAPGTRQRTGREAGGQSLTCP